MSEVSHRNSVCRGFRGFEHPVSTSLARLFLTGVWNFDTSIQAAPGFRYSKDKIKVTRLLRRNTPSSTYLFSERTNNTIILWLSIAEGTKQLCFYIYDYQPSIATDTPITQGCCPVSVGEYSSLTIEEMMFFKSSCQKTPDG